MRIAVDAMGGDNAPYEIVVGALDAVKGNPDITVVLVGKEDEINKIIDEKTKDRSGIEVVNATEVIEFDDVPTKAVRSKKDSSLVVAMKLVKDKQADAFLSAGSTGAILVGGLFIVGRIKGIDRPALTGFFPNPKGYTVLLDIGANADCKARNILEFGVMGSLYAEKVLGIKNPSVGLLNNGTEEGKGNDLTKEAFALMKGSDQINFYGNIEGRDMPAGTVDVAVTDGFTGNVVLKTTEGVASTIMKMMKDALMSSTKGKIAGAMIKSDMKALKDGFSADAIGGAPFLGVDGVVLKAHGNSRAIAITNAILQARRFKESNYIEELKAHIEQL
ncbi:MAG: phosphate acyltransferase PlsX [Proteocatella sp.]|nr:phosphate acyltransferase PlsX [Proteocatella sp.]MBP8653933.1 phosphate acyltransferase PlsX [Proteocatella sp.]MBP9658813.1 phosphate acyltransferase PlsX [Proteocatella sp.]MBP9966602.1 phosphate acyltransferase PlsX [Proteocatella sp.]